jgi:hypothetical protein
MAMLGIFFGRAARNDPLRVQEKNPRPRYPDATHPGNVPLAGYKVLSQASPENQGSPPFIEAVPTHRHSDDSFEQ